MAIMEMDTENNVQILSAAVCFSHRINPPEKDIYLTILPPANGK